MRTKVSSGGSFRFSTSRDETNTMKQLQQSSQIFQREVSVPGTHRAVITVTNQILLLEQVNNWL